MKKNALLFELAESLSPSPIKNIIKYLSKGGHPRSRLPLFQGCHAPLKGRPQRLFVNQER